MKVLERPVHTSPAPPRPGPASPAGPGWGRHLAAAAWVAGSAVVAALWTPRGPVTVGESMGTMGLGLLTGLGAGWLARTRWGVLAVPALYAAAFEATRLSASGPTVDGLNLGDVYGLMAAASGRGGHGLLLFPALIAGFLVGSVVARAGRNAAATGRRRVFEAAAIGLSALVVVATGVAVAIPAHTEPIRARDGSVARGSVAELTRVAVTGGRLNVLIRGVSAAQPVLLFLAGGPGGSEFGAMRRHGQLLEQDFVVATLDQRGTGSSYDQLEPLATHTLANAVTDVIEVTEYLRDRFHQPVYLVGQSWGSILGVLAAQQRPDLYSAFIGVGQMVDPAETDRVFYADTLAWARGQGNAEFVGKLEQAGPPPYADLLDYPTIFTHEQQVYGYSHDANAEGAGQMLENLPVAEYSFLDTVTIVRGLLDTFAALYPQLQELDLRQSAPELEVPVYLVEGRFEPRGRKEPARDWFQQLRAPRKGWVEFDTSGHRPLFEQPARFAALMREISRHP